MNTLSFQTSKLLTARQLSEVVIMLGGRTHPPAVLSFFYLKAPLVQGQLVTLIMGTLSYLLWALNAGTALFK